MKRSLFLLFFAAILVLGMMMIFDSYKKVQTAGVFGKSFDEDLPLYEIIEDESQLTDVVSFQKTDEVHIDSLYKDFNNQTQYLKAPFKSIRPELKRKYPKTSGGKRKEPPKTLPIPFDETEQYIEVSKQAQKPKVLQTTFGNVISKESINKLVVKGENIGGQYFDNIFIEIYGNDNNLINTIRPQTNLGYAPNILLADFVGNGLDQVFLGINSGGSGGFGYFYVFDVSNNQIKTLFDYQEFSSKNQYTGRYINYYRAEVVKTDSSAKYIIDLSARPKDYLDMIWGPDGKLLTPKSIDISDVNTVFAYYNSSTQLFELMIFQRVTGLYNADSLGYVITQQHIENDKFVTFYQSLSVFSQ
jgi:hypothetical protein